MDFTGTSQSVDQLVQEAEEQQHEQSRDDMETEHRETNTEERPSTVIFGTDISVEHVINVFRDFLTSYTKRDEKENEHAKQLEEEVFTKSYFQHQFESIHSMNQSHFDFNIQLLLQHTPECNELYNQLVLYPQEILPILEMVVNAVYHQVLESIEEDQHLSLRPQNLKRKSGIKQLDPRDIDTLVAISGVVLRCSEIVPELRQGCFQCGLCKAKTYTAIVNSCVVEPVLCSNCGTKNRFRLIHNRSLFLDKQVIKLQESVEDLAEGETPHTLQMVCYQNLVNKVQPGDRVEVTGILRAKGIRITPGQRVLHTVFQKYLDVVFFKKVSADSNIDSLVRQRRKQLFQWMTASSNLYEDLARSIAPSLYGLDDIKKGILCLLVGGANSFEEESGEWNEESKEAEEKGSNTDSSHEESSNETVKRTRGEINILLCGDPGTAKSQLLSFVNRLSPRGIYTSGKGSSSVGLTAYVSRDIDTGETVLESGALVLSDKGICCIDEFDKMSDTTRAILHECMEQQTISIAKAGIITSLNARTSILASANPIQSKYNPRLSIVHNINLPPTLLSRFDLIFLVLDKVDEGHDRQLGTHVVRLFSNSDGGDQPRENEFYEVTFDSEVAEVDEFLRNESEDGKKLVYSIKVLKEFIAYVRQQRPPLIGDSAKVELVDQYLKMRAAGSKYGPNIVGKKIISATTRQLESLIRLSEALAKMSLAKEVLPTHVVEAVRLMQEATQKSATDPRSGVIDMDAIHTGIGNVDRHQIKQLGEMIFKILSEVSINQAKLTSYDLTQKLGEEYGGKLSAVELQRALVALQNDDKINVNKRSGEITLTGNTFGTL